MNMLCPCIVFYVITSQGWQQRGAGGNYSPSISVGGGLAPPIYKNYEDGMCVAAACTRCISQRATTIYTHVQITNSCPTPVLQVARVHMWYEHMTESRLPPPPPTPNCCRCLCIQLCHYNVYVYISEWMK